MRERWSGAQPCQSEVSGGKEQTLNLISGRWTLTENDEVRWMVMERQTIMKTDRGRDGNR